MLAGLLTAVSAALRAAPLLGDIRPFSLERLRKRAAELAARPYQAPASRLPAVLDADCHRHEIRRWPPCAALLKDLCAALPHAMPPPAPLAVPAQPLHQPRTLGAGHFGGRRVTVFGAVAMLARVFALGGLSLIEDTFIRLFAINFGWIALSFWRALTGLVVSLCGGDLAGLDPGRPRGRALRAAFARPIALVMPTHNEDPQRVLLAVETLYHEPADHAVLACLEYLVLGDTTDPERCRAAEVTAATLATQFPREIQAAALADYRALTSMLMRCQLRTMAVVGSGDEVFEAGSSGERA